MAGKRGTSLGEPIQFRRLPRTWAARVRAYLSAASGRRQLTNLAKTFHATGVSLGVASRKGSLEPGQGLVLKFWVEEKQDEPPSPVPRWLSIDLPSRVLGSRSRHGRAVLFATDVSRVIREEDGEALAVDVALATVSDGGAQANGCLAARVAWKRPDGTRTRAWLSAGHVCTMGSVLTSFPPPAFAAASPAGLGAVLEESCWIASETGEELDAGLIGETTAGTLKGTVASRVDRIVPGSDLDPKATYYVVDKHDSVRAVEFHTEAPAGTVTLKLPGGGSHTYPRTFLFKGESEPGDSGTCIVRAGVGQSSLVGLLAGRHTGEHGREIVVVPAEDIVKALRDVQGGPVKFVPVA